MRGDSDVWHRRWKPVFVYVIFFYVNNVVYCISFFLLDYSVHSDWYLGSGGPLMGSAVMHPVWPDLKNAYKEYSRRQNMFNNYFWMQGMLYYTVRSWLVPWRAHQFHKESTLHYFWLFVNQSFVSTATGRNAASRYFAVRHNSDSWWRTSVTLI